MNKELLWEMLSTPSASGRETELGKKLYGYAGTFSHQVRTDEIGDVVAVLNPDCGFRVLLAGHMDEIALLVTAVTQEGFLRVNRTGGVFAPLYPGHKVQVITEHGPLYGSVVFTREMAKKEDLAPKDLYIDIGAKSKEDALAHVSLGDPVIFDTDCRELLNGCVTGRGMDNRTGALGKLYPLMDHDHAFSDEPVIFSQTTESPMTLEESAFDSVKYVDMDFSRLLVMEKPEELDEPQWTVVISNAAALAREQAKMKGR